jgi:hypothetical protein
MAGIFGKQNQQKECRPEGSTPASAARLNTGNRPAAAVQAAGRTPWYRWLKWGDFLLYGIIGGSAILLMVLLPRMIGQQQVLAAVLRQDQQPVFSMSQADLRKTGETEIIANGYHYTIRWQDGRIRFAAADCPDKVCVNTGWISRPGEIAACVPGHLILKIEASGTTGTTDPDVVVK